MSPGTHQGYVHVLGEDGLAADDYRYFTFDVRPAPKILLAVPAIPYARFLSQALAPDPDRRTGRAKFDISVVLLDQLAKQPLDQYGRHRPG